MRNPQLDHTGHLSTLTSELGLYWTLWCEGETIGACPPQTPCALQGARCSLACPGGDCPAARTLQLGSSGRLRLACCRAAPSLPPDQSLVSALVNTLQSGHQAQREMSEAVRELTATYQELAIAYGMMETISLHTSREAIAAAALDHIQGAVPAESAVALYLDEHGSLQTLASHEMIESDLEAVQHYVVNQGCQRPELDEPARLPLGSRQMLLGGLARGDRCSTLLAVTRPQEQPFTSREAKLLHAAGRQAAIALRNQALVQDLRTLFINTIEALAAAVEVKDPYTCGHSRRVAEAARETARVMGLPEVERQDIYTTGIMHDLGKIAVDNSILHKPGKLTEPEWEVVRGHPEQGAIIIGRVPQLRHIVPGVRHHHERWDGGGYPDGLRGSQIPLPASIVAVCDAFDALTSHRPYRPPLSAGEAREELAASRGAHFSTTVVDAFLEAVAA